MTTTIDSQESIITINDTENEKLASLIENMEANGWVGLPIIVVIDENNEYYAITGSHRVKAARATFTNIEAITFELNEENAEIIECRSDDDRLRFMEELLEAESIDEEIVEIMRAELLNNY